MQQNQYQIQINPFIINNQPNENQQKSDNITQYQSQNIQMSPSQFERFQPEIIYRISQFLQFHQYLELRLLSHFMNQRISQISILKQNSINQKIEQLLSQSEVIKSQINYKTLNEEYQFKIKEVDKLTNQLNMTSILELRSYNNPPNMVQKIISYLMMLLDFQNFNKHNSWIDMRKFLQKPYVIVVQLQQIQNYDITQAQLERILPILEIPEQQVYNISFACGVFCAIIQIIIKNRISNNYYLWSQQQNIEKELKICDEQQRIMNKIIYQSNY